MNRKLQFLNVFLGLIVLFAILFQSIHSFEHLAQQFSKNQCIHKYTGKETLTHSHSWEKCLICEFALSNHTTISKYSFDFNHTSKNLKYTFAYSKEVYHSFKGSLFSLRAPPSFIV